MYPMLDDHTHLLCNGHAPVEGNTYAQVGVTEGIQWNNKRGRKL